VRWLVLAIVIAGGSRARADGAVDEVSAGSVQQSATTPKSAWLANKVGGFWEPTEAWQLRVDVTTLHDITTKQAPVWSFGEPGDMLIGNLSLEYDPDDHWSIRVVGGYSPTSTTTSTTSVQLPTTAADARVQADTSTVTGAAWLGYDTGTEDDYETSLTLTGGVNALDSLQQITSVTGRNGQMVQPDQIRSFCASHPCSSQLGAALAAAPIQLAQGLVDANVTETLYRDTDVGIDGAYYFYDKDPTQLGNFSATAAGRAVGFSGAVAIAPLRFTVAPDVIQRWGRVMALASLSYGRYVDDQGYDVTATLRFQYKLKLAEARRLKMWAKAVASRDRGTVDTSSGSVAIGTQFSW